MQSLYRAYDEVGIPEIWIQIFTELSLKDISSVRLVCKEWRELANDKEVWRVLIKELIETLDQNPENRMFSAPLTQDVVFDQNSSWRSRFAFIKRLSLCFDRKIVPLYDADFSYAKSLEKSWNDWFINRTIGMQPKSYAKTVAQEYLSKVVNPKLGECFEIVYMYGKYSKYTPMFNSIENFDTSVSLEYVYDGKSFVEIDSSLNLKEGRLNFGEFKLDWLGTLPLTFWHYKGTHQVKVGSGELLVLRSIHLNLSPFATEIRKNLVTYQPLPRFEKEERIFGVTPIAKRLLCAFLSHFVFQEKTYHILGSFSEKESASIKGGIPTEDEIVQILLKTQLQQQTIRENKIFSLHRELEMFPSIKASRRLFESEFEELKCYPPYPKTRRFVYTGMDGKIPDPNNNPLLYALFSQMTIHDVLIYDLMNGKN